MAAKYYIQQDEKIDYRIGLKGSNSNSATSQSPFPLAAIKRNRVNEIKNYKDNVLSFISELKGKLVKSVHFNMETDPVIDFLKVPFQFKYCLSVSFETEEKKYEIFTSMTSEGFETFWVKQSDNIDASSEVLPINLILEEFSIELKDKYIYKLDLQFENSALFLYAGEIYDSWNGELEYKIQDEMILVFKDIQEAKKFEKMVESSTL